MHVDLVMKFYKVYFLCFRDNVWIIQCSWTVYCCTGSPGFGCVVGFKICQWTHTYWDSGWQWRWSYTCYSCSKSFAIFSSVLNAMQWVSSLVLTGLSGCSIVLKFFRGCTIYKIHCINFTTFWNCTT